MHATEAMHGHAQFAVGIVHVAIGEDLHHALHLVQYLLEPQFIGLVDDDEEHLVVRGGTLLIALWCLCAQDLVQLQVVGVVH